MLSQMFRLRIGYAQKQVPKEHNWTNRNITISNMEEIIMFSTADRRKWEETYEKDLKAFLVGILKATQTQTGVEDLVHNYNRFLSEKYPPLLKGYCNRKPDSARVEAVTFHFFKNHSDDIQVKEDPVKGGVDFQCKTDTAKFMVEVTCLDTESVACKSGLKNESPLKRSSEWYSGITSKLFGTAKKKASQISGYDCPRILVIACEHPQADMLLGTLDAEFLLTGEQKIAVVPFSNSTGNLDSVTDLKNSVFFRYNKEIGQLESCRRSISAILLFSVFNTNAFIVGILHPDPVHKLPIEFFSSVPFVRLKKWSPENSILEIEWINYKKPGQVIHEPEPYNFWYDKALTST